MSEADAGIAENAIAIIGMDGRFSGSDDIEHFWRNLRDGVECISFFSDGELKAAGVSDAELEDPAYVRARGVLNGYDRFDAGFFGYSPSEAEIMDPQHRVFLECGWSALEDAGYAPANYDGLIGVYAGTSVNTYFINNLYPLRGTGKLFAIDKDFVSTRLSYKLNLKGPSLSVQTACSTSLVAICEACQSLLDYRCDIALAGGVSITTPAVSGYRYQEGSISSRDGHCRAFDADASGTISGAGAGVVALKRLSDAIDDGDSIRAVIRGFSVNNDGSDKVGYSAPSVSGQAEVVAMALALAELEADAISYVECHGTGTTLGDPIEIAALTRAFRETSDRAGTCAIGSVKPNIGHLDAAAGVAGLIKTVLALQHQKLPPSLNYRAPNPKIDFEQSPFFVNTELRDWQTTDGEPRRAGVSSFGIGGTNAHVVVEEAPQQQVSAEQEGSQLLPLSARSEAALDAATANLAMHLRKHPQQRLADIAWTLQAGRHVFDHRRMLVCHDREDAVSVLEQKDGGRMLSAIGEVRERRCVFMFSGQGSQYPNMTLGLYRACPGFRENVDRCCGLLQAHLGINLLDLLYPPPSEEDSAAAQLTETRYAQPALFVIEYALAQHWINWGIKPDAMIGHSIGEYAAACLAGVFTLEDALAVVAARGRLMHAQPRGTMLSVPLAANEVEPLLTPGLSVAVVNAPSMCVVSGPDAAVESFEKTLAEQGHAVSRLHTSHAFHSAMMQPAADELRTLLGDVSLSPPTRAVISNLSGERLTAEQATDPDYWARHLRFTVQFSSGVEHLLQESDRWYLEVGPGNTLSSLLRLQPGCAVDTPVFSSVRHPRESLDDARFLLNTLGQVWLAGIQPDWSAVHDGEPMRRVPLPTYPFQRSRYWIEADAGAGAAVVSPAPAAARMDIGDWCYVPSWTRTATPALARAQRSGTPVCLLISRGDAADEALAVALRDAGESVTEAYAGRVYECVEAGRKYRLDPGSDADYRKLFEELAGRDSLPDSIVYLPSLQRSADYAGASEADRLRETCFFDLLKLVRAIGAVPSEKRQQLVIISSEIHDVVGVESLCPDASLLLGICRVAGYEYPQLQCRNIDFERGEDARVIAGRIRRECAAEDPETVVAYRGGHRWLPGEAPLHTDLPDAAPLRLRQNGTYLITGGLGGIGLALAKYLARRVQANIVLIARSGVPPREEWDDWLSAHAREDRTSVRISGIREIELSGGRVHLASVDVTDTAELARCVADAEDLLGPVKGVIHAAGIPGGGVMQLRSRETAAAVLSPKVEGTRALAELFSERQPDFLVLCSSLASVFGGPGQADYCAANAWMDAFAHQRDHQNIVSINWDTWGEAGMAVEADVPETLAENRDRALKMGIATAEGIEIFERIMAMESLPAQVLVSTRDLMQVHQRRAETVSAPVDVDETEVAGSSSGHQRPALSMELVPPRTETEKRVAGIWEEVFKIDGLGIHDNFFELGGHSLMAIQVASRLRESLHTEISIDRFLELATIEAVSAFVEVNLNTGNKPGMGSPEDNAGERDEFDI